MFTNFLYFLALGVGSLAIQFDCPSQTHTADPVAVNLDGWTPCPTLKPRSVPLFRRQTDEAICGFLDGDNEYPVSCTIGTCAYDPANSWFGCCTGTAIDDCAIFTTCIASASMSACNNDPACASDALALGCTAASAPNCMTMLSSVSEGTVSHFVCGESTGVTVDVLSTGTGTGSLDSASATGLSRTLSATGRPSTSTRRTTTSAFDDETSTEEPTAEETEDETEDEPSSQRPERTTARTSSSSAGTPSSTAGAVRTAQAVAAAAGGMAGVLAWLV